MPKSLKVMGLEIREGMDVRGDAPECPRVLFA